MSKLIEDFKEIRKVSTPWCAIRTTDWFATVKTILKVRYNGEDETPVAVLWTCVDGPVSPVVNTDSVELSKKNDEILGDEETALSTVLKNAKTKLEAGGILFVVLPDNTAYDNPLTVQALSDLREPFKTTRRTLVLLGTDPKMPSFIAEDVPVLEDPLPNEEELEVCFKNVADANELIYKPDEFKKAATACLGMTRFAGEEAFSRKMRPKRIDLASLVLAQREVVEASTDRALRFEKEVWKFAQMGGVEAFKSFAVDVWNGPKKPSLVVRVDEIDKSITAASTGSVADNTGVSQDILKCLLTSLEENKWMGMIACGGPGTGKTLASICVGNEFDTRCLSMDLGAVKGSLVGQTEGKMRRMMDVLKTIGGENVLFIATANRLDTMPPELQRRFWLGTWFWDLPTEEEKKNIWKIQRERYKINEKDVTPKDDNWTGSDCRNCCQMAWLCNSTLQEAAQRITIAGIVSRQSIESLRDLAERSGFRSASTPGPYKKPVKEAAKRKVTVGV